MGGRPALGAVPGAEERTRARGRGSVPENGRGARERRGDWRADYAALGGAALVAAMRQGDARALEEFIARHRALLVHEARRCGIPEGEREDAAAEVLHDTAVRLMTTRSAAPRSLAAY